MHTLLAIVCVYLAAAVQFPCQGDVEARPGDNRVSEKLESEGIALYDVPWFILKFATQAVREKTQNERQN